VTPTVDIMALARAERADLADLLVTLEPAQWDVPSLCTGWPVRDVVAHVFSYDTLSTGDLVRRFVAGRLNGDRVNALGVAAYADHSTEELLALVKEHPQPRGLPAGFGGRIALTDGLIHHQDIRRALGIPRDVPTDRHGPPCSSLRRHPRLKEPNEFVASALPPPMSTGRPGSGRRWKALGRRC
jgi:uncharacterized protein (TIGR03083 family)